MISSLCAYRPQARNALSERFVMLDDAQQLFGMDSVALRSPGSAHDLCWGHGSQSVLEMEILLPCRLGRWVAAPSPAVAGLGSELYTLKRGERKTLVVVREGSRWVCCCVGFFCNVTFLTPCPVSVKCSNDTELLMAVWGIMDKSWECIQIHHLELRVVWPPNERVQCWL